MGFVHLHCHSDYSLLEAPLRISTLIELAKSNNMSHVALTDNGVMYGAVDFYLQAKANGINPIIGCDVYLCDTITEKVRARQRLILLCINQTGYQNLIKLVTTSHLAGFYYKPRLDIAHLTGHTDGLIAISPGITGPIGMAIQDHQDAYAETLVQTFNTLFPNRFYLGISRLGYPYEDMVIQSCAALSKRLNTPLVVTNDVYYPSQKSAFLRDILSCIQRGQRLDDTNFRFESEQHYFKSEADMATLFSDLPDAIYTTQHIADQCQLELKTDQVLLPHFQCPDGLSSEAYLEKKVWEGIHRKYDPVTDSIKERVNFELSTITKMLYANYFLIIHDFLDFCYQQDIPVGPGRGSAAGSIVSYALDITRVDPIAYQLLFERFLNPERVSMPDVDIDFCIRRRHEVIDYIVKTYGESCVSQIITFGTMQARAAIRDVGRVLNIPLSDVDRVAKLVPAVPGQSVSIQESINDIPELNQLYAHNSELKKLLDISIQIEGLSRHSSTHAAGVVISRDPLESVVPLVTNDGQVATQYAMSDIEKIGLLKMDILGLRNLTVMKDTVDMIESRHGVLIDLNQLPLDDEATYTLLCKGTTTGIFQLESRGMRQLIKNLAPKDFEDIVALLALYRPGPLGSGMVNEFVSNKSGKTTAKYTLPQLEPILKSTYGIILYQEQVMQIASVIGGFTLAQADMLRRAMGKKKKKEMDEMRALFIQGAKSQQLDTQKAKHIFDLCYKFAEYGFNKSHSAAYALVSYQTAYLKANYPVEYMASLLSSVVNNADKTTLYTQECVAMGLTILPPSILSSGFNFTVSSDTQIRYGLGAIKNVGEGAIESIISNRSESPESNLGEFLIKLDLKQVNKRVIESLIKAGALDHFGERGLLLTIYEQILERAQIAAREQQNGQVALFANTSNTSGISISDLEDTDYVPISNQEKLRLEKEMVGTYISGHPLDDVREELQKMTTSTQTISQSDDQKTVTLMGLLTGCRKLITKTKKEMLTGTLEDLFGSIPLVMFHNDHFEEIATIFQDGHIVRLEGRVRLNNDEPTIMINHLTLIDNASLKKSLFIDIESLEDHAVLHQIKSITQAYKGDTPVYFKSGETTIKSHPKYWVSDTQLIQTQLEPLLGYGRVWLG